MQIKTRQLLHIGLFFIFLLWNYWQPLTADDYGYSLANLLSEHNVIKQLGIRYLTWDGRISADLLAYTFLNINTLQWGIVLVNVINSFVLVGILDLICRFIYSKSYTAFEFILTSFMYILYFVAIKAFSQDFLWKTVAIQYAWGFFLLLWVIWQFFSNLNSQKSSSLLSIWFYAMLGVGIGLYNEIFVGFVFSLYLAVCLFWYLDKKPFRQIIKAEYIVFFLAVLIGGVILIAAPGNYIHRGLFFSDNHIDPNSFSIVTRIAMTYVRFFRYGYHALIAIFMLYAVYWLIKHRSEITAKDYRFLLFLVVLLNLNILSFFEVAYYSPVSGRMLIFIDSIIFIFICKFFIVAVKTTPKYFNQTLYILTGLLFILITCAYYSCHQFILKRQHEINIHQANQSIDIISRDTNKLFEYIIYFDAMRTSDTDFKKVYDKIGIN